MYLKITRSGIRLLLLSAVLACLGGCLGGGDKVAFYVVNPADLRMLDADGNADKVSIELLNLRVPAYLERSHIAVRTGENSMTFSEYNQWGENLRKNLMRTLSRNLGHLLDTSEISTPLNRSSTEPDYRLEVLIDQFELDTDGYVRLSARWQLIDAASDAPLGLKSADLTAGRTVDGKDYESMVGEMRDLFGQLSVMIAEDIRAARRSG